MGAVHRATDLHTGGPVAVKALHPALARDPVYRERLRREGVDYGDGALPGQEQRGEGEPAPRRGEAGGDPAPVLRAAPTGGRRAAPVGVHNSGRASGGTCGIIAGSCSSTCSSWLRSLGRPCVATASWWRRTSCCGSSSRS